MLPFLILIPVSDILPFMHKFWKLCDFLWVNLIISSQTLVNYSQFYINISINFVVGKVK